MFPKRSRGTREFHSTEKKKEHERIVRALFLKMRRNVLLKEFAKAKRPSDKIKKQKEKCTCILYGFVV